MWRGRVVGKNSSGEGTAGAQPLSRKSDWARFVYQLLPKIVPEDKWKATVHTKCLAPF